MSIGILPNVNSVKRHRDVSSALNAPFPTGRLKNNQTKKPKKDEGKSAVAMLKSVQQLGCVSHDIEPPDSTRISWQGQWVLETIR